MGDDAAYTVIDPVFCHRILDWTSSFQPDCLDFIFMPFISGCDEQHLCSLATTVAKSADSVIICSCGLPMLRVCLLLSLCRDLYLIFIVIMLPKLAIVDCGSINYEDCIEYSGADNNMQKLFTDVQGGDSFF